MNFVEKNKGMLIVVGSILAVVLLIVFSLFGLYNKAVTYEENIKAANSLIQNQLKAREDKLYNLADSVKSYNNYEGNTLVEVIKARRGGDESSATSELDKPFALLVEDYPELKSVENYKTYMTEITTIENKISNARDNLVYQVEQYNNLLRHQPGGFFLGLMGYEKVSIDYPDFNASQDAPRGLLED